MLGQKVSVVTGENKATGYHEITWNSSNPSCGIFLITITAVGTETGQNYK